MTRATNDFHDAGSDVQRGQPGLTHKKSDRKIEHQE